MFAKLNLSTVVDNYCQRRVFFFSGKIAQAITVVEHGHSRLAENGKRIHGDWLTAAHCPQGSVLKNALAVSLIFRKHGSLM